VKNFYYLLGYFHTSCGFFSLGSKIISMLWITACQLSRNIILIVNDEDIGFFMNATRMNIKSYHKIYCNLKFSADNWNRNILKMIFTVKFFL
jgi:hypothetical protein